jgi:hypothetical protein
MRFLPADSIAAIMGARKGRTMGRKPDSPLGFPWEQKNKAEAGTGGNSSQSSQGPREPVAEEVKANSAFPGETTREYDLDEATLKSSARSEISLDEAAAVEDTRELEVPRSLTSQRRKVIPDEVKEQWEKKPRLLLRIRRRWNSEPIVIWYHSKPVATRRAVGRLAWILSASLMMVAVFIVSALVFYPEFETYVRPMFAPRPKEPIRFSVRQGEAFDLVEERSLSADKFRLATECVWLARTPEESLRIDVDGLALLDRNMEQIASLDLRENWDGLLRIFFGTGKIPVGEPLYIRIPVVDGGMWTVSRHRDYRLMARGGRVPPAYVVGPITFMD